MKNVRIITIVKEDHIYIKVGEINNTLPKHYTTILLDKDLNIIPKQGAK